MLELFQDQILKQCNRCILLGCMYFYEVFHLISTCLFRQHKPSSQWVSQYVFARAVFKSVPGCCVNEEENDGCLRCLSGVCVWHPERLVRLRGGNAGWLCCDSECQRRWRQFPYPDEKHRKSSILHRTAMMMDSRADISHLRKRSSGGIFNTWLLLIYVSTTITMINF